jgi:hypothetical protein
MLMAVVDTFPWSATCAVIRRFTSQTTILPVSPPTKKTMIRRCKSTHDRYQNATTFLSPPTLHGSISHPACNACVFYQQPVDRLFPRMRCTKQPLRCMPAASFVDFIADPTIIYPTTIEVPRYFATPSKLQHLLTTWSLDTTFTLLARFPTNCFRFMSQL